MDIRCPNSVSATLHRIEIGIVSFSHINQAPLKVVPKPKVGSVGFYGVSERSRRGSGEVFIAVGNEYSDYWLGQANGTGSG